jgi:DNA replication protein DnaC
VGVNTSQNQQQNKTETMKTMETNNKTAPAIQEKDRNTISLDLMNRMNLHGMATAFRESLQSTVSEAMTADSFLSFLLAREWDYRSDASIQRLIRQAGFRYKAYLEEIDYTINRCLDRNQMERLSSLDFIRQGQNLFITGSSGTGKSYIATAIGYQACKDGIRTNYASASKLMGALKVAKTKGIIEAELKKIERCPLLILDDLFLVPLDAKERPILLDIIEDRHERKSIIVTSQLPVADWYDAIGDPTVADAILDRIVHSAHQIELTGESVRKMKVSKNK